MPMTAVSTEPHHIWRHATDPEEWGEVASPLEQFFIRFLEGAALEASDRQARGAEMDEGFGYTPEHHPGEEIIEACDDFLNATGYWYWAEVHNTMDDLFGDDDFPF